MEPPPLADDLRHYQEHYQQMFHQLDILRAVPGEPTAHFRIVSRLDSRRTLEVLLTETCFHVQKDSQEEGSLVDTKLESFEQLLSALDGAETFGSRLCDLVSQRLAGLSTDQAEEEVPDGP
mmetsp:Transcript_49968/g.93490  ORF Transcript_49968/g.93490 Transcript_49968/m.93490 type:complete len:121 (+) Transcript_49968:62-424(+)